MGTCERDDAAHTSCTYVEACGKNIPRKQPHLGRMYLHTHSKPVKSPDEPGEWQLCRHPVLRSFSSLWSVAAKTQVGANRTDRSSRAEKELATTRPRKSVDCEVSGL